MSLTEVRAWELRHGDYVISHHRMLTRGAVVVVIELAVTTSDSWWTPPQRESWMSEALCAQVDPDAFFPEKGGSTRQAKAICAECPVRMQCLAYALEHDETTGIWGGLTPRERRALAQGSDDRASEHVMSRVRELHAKGLMDTEIAPAVGLSAVQVGRIRRSMNLPRNYVQVFRRNRGSHERRAV